MEEETKPLVKVLRDWYRGMRYKKQIIRHKNTFITLKNDEEGTMYCSCCWDKEKELIQVDKLYGGRFQCPNCKQVSCYDEKLTKETSVISVDSEINQFVKYNGVRGRRE